MNFLLSFSKLLIHQDLTVYVHCVSPAVIKYSLVFDTKHKILPPNTCGVVQTFYSNVSFSLFLYYVEVFVLSRC